MEPGTAARAARALADSVAALPSPSGLPPDASALLLWIRGTTLIATGQPAAAEPLLRRLLVRTDDLRWPQLHAYGLLWLGVTRIGEAVDESIDLLDGAARIFRDLGDHWRLALALSCRGGLAVLRGDPKAAAPIHAEGLAAAETAHNDYLRAQLLDKLSLDALIVGDLGGARAHYAAAADLHTRLLDREGSSYGITGLATIALVQGQLEVAAQLMGAAAQARATVGAAVWPDMLPLAEALRESVRGALGQLAFARASAEGTGTRASPIAAPDPDQPAA